MGGRFSSHKVFMALSLPVSVESRLSKLQLGNPKSTLVKSGLLKSNSRKNSIRVGLRVVKGLFVMLVSETDCSLVIIVPDLLGSQDIVPDFDFVNLTIKKVYSTIRRINKIT